VATRLGLFAQWIHLLVPKVAEITMSTAFRMFPETAPAAAGAPAAEAPPPAPTPTPEAIAFAQLVRGLHW
jgi:hypothetical protein